MSAGVSGGQVDGRLGSRSLGYHPVAPRPLRYGPFVHRFSCACHLQRRSTSSDMRDLCWWRKELGEKWQVNLACDSDFHVNRRVLLHATNLRHGTYGFTSPPKEGMLWIFSPEKSDGFGRVRTRDLGYQRPWRTGADEEVEGWEKLESAKEGKHNEMWL
jgi:hypothetical protein